MNKRLLCAGALMCLLPTAGFAAEGVVSWADPTCGYFILKLPDGDPNYAYGLFSVKAPPVPKMDDVIEGEVQTAQEPTVKNQTSGASHDVIHWADAREPKMLIRNSPVQCASRWKKKN